MAAPLIGKQRGLLLRERGCAEPHSLYVKESAHPTLIMPRGYYARLRNQARLWNLFLIQGDNGEEMERLWDVSLGNTDGGGQALFVFDHRGGEVLTGSEGIEIPIGAWFHVEFRLLRSGDASGLVALRQDGVLLLETRRPTDDTSWGQWYVGNLADGRSPPDSTVYVDDVSIRAAP